jgi:hypothetical protein
VNGLLLLVAFLGVILLAVLLVFFAPKDRRHWKPQDAERAEVATSLGLFEDEKNRAAHISHRHAAAQRGVRIDGGVFSDRQFSRDKKKRENS